MKYLVATISGIIFGLGMVISGMVDPENIIRFLDVTGEWKPDLAFVMGGAILVFAPMFWLIIRRQKKPVFDESFGFSYLQTIDIRLIGGSALFGLGWGIGGICPGPALTSLAFGHLGIWVFFAAMMVGLGGTHLVLRFIEKRKQALQAV